MSILGAHLVHATVLDMYAGSGALGLEALSRGAAHATFVDSDAASLEALRANIQSLGADEMCTLHRADALAFAAALPPHAYDVAFADPPFASEAAGTLAAQWQQTPFASVLGIEHAAATPILAGDTRRYGTVAITLYRSGQ